MTTDAMYSPRRRVVTVVAVLSVMACVLVARPVPAAVADTPGTSAPLPVPYNFIFDAVRGGLSDSPPGTNDWSCRPTQAHPNPVVLVHGFIANRSDNWQTYGPLLRNHGYCVFAINYGGFGLVGGLAPMEDSAAVLGEFVNRVLQVTGAKKVALLGHSEGATMPHWYLKFDGGASKVSQFIGLSAVVHGSGSGPGGGFPQIGNGGEPAGFELTPTSAFIHRLNAGGITQPGVNYTQILTRYDDIVIPYTSGYIAEPGVSNIVLQDQCPTDYADHLSIASDPVAAQYILNALDPAQARPVQCTTVWPVVGVLPGASMPPGVSVPSRR